MMQTSAWDLNSRQGRPSATVSVIKHNLPMHTLYDSDTYSVTHMLANAVAADVPAEDLKDGEQLLIVPRLARHGFEIVDKRSGKEVYLDGSWAELFQQHISAWQLKTPTQEEVEDTLEKYAELAQNPVVLH
jgi:hypothetical protein